MRPRFPTFWDGVARGMALGAITAAPLYIVVAVVMHDGLNAIVGTGLLLLGIYIERDTRKEKR